MTAQFNKLAVRKELGAMAYRLRDTNLDPLIKARILRRHIDNLLDALPVRYHALLQEMSAADTASVGVGIDVITGMLPPVTYGEIPAGTAFRMADHPGTVVVKRKGGVEFHGIIIGHLDGDCRILEV